MLCDGVYVADNYIELEQNMYATIREKLKLGKIYKRIPGVSDIFPGYIVLTSIDDIVAGHKKYVYVDVESGNESDIIMYEYVVRDYYRLVEDE